MRRKISTISMILGAVLVLAASSLLLWNQYDSRRADGASQKLLAQVRQTMQENESAEEAAAPEGEALESFEAEDEPKDASEDLDISSCIGILSIPGLGLELPVQSQWSYPRLRVAPCRYTGAIETGDLVISAHNYTRHFGLLSSLQPGDPVSFTDMEGNVYSFQVALIEVLSPTDSQSMTDSGYPLTLFTCTYGGQNRVTVRCGYTHP